MQKNIKISIVLSLIFGFCGVFLIRKYIKKEHLLFEKTLSFQNVIVSKKKILKGDMVKRDDFITKPLPKNQTTDDMLLKEALEHIEGHELLRNILPGDVLLISHFEDNKKNSKITLKKNERLVPMYKDFDFKSLSDNDSIDIILSAKNLHGLTTTRTIIQNVKVLKIPRDESTENDTENYYLIMNALQAQIYVHIREKGKLSYVIRNKEDLDTNNTPSVNDSNFLKGENYFNSKKNTKPLPEIISSSF